MPSTQGRQWALTGATSIDELLEVLDVHPSGRVLRIERLLLRDALDLSGAVGSHQGSIDYRVPSLGPLSGGFLSS